MCDSFVGLYDSFGVARGVVAEDSGWELEDVMIVSDVSGSSPIGELLFEQSTFQ